MQRFRRAPVTIALLLIIFLVFAFERWSGALENDRALIRLGAIVPFMIQQHQYWRAVTAIFLHASLLHWAANSWALYQLGTLYESMFGSRRFALIYFSTGIIASFASSLAMSAPTFTEPYPCGVGASGAVLGILGAFIFSIKRSPLWRHEPWTRNLLSQLLFWAAVNIVLGMVIKNIDNVAHIAGLTTGLILGFLPHRVVPPPPRTSVVDVRGIDSTS